MAALFARERLYACVSDHTPPLFTHTYTRLFRSKSNCDWDGCASSQEPFPSPIYYEEWTFLPGPRNEQCEGPQSIEGF